jgi:transposase, IS6 family
MLAVRGYLRYRLSYRDGEELLAERAIEVDHVSIYRWVQRLARCWSKQPAVSPRRR